MNTRSILVGEYRFFVVNRKGKKFIVDEPELRCLELPVEDIMDQRERIMIGGRVYLRQGNPSVIGNVTKLDYACEERHW